MQPTTEEQWIIVSNKPGRGRPYWRPLSAGYTETIIDAGKYSAEEAQSIVWGNKKEDLAFSLDDDALLEFIKAESLVRANELLLWRKLRTTAPAAPAAAVGLAEDEIAELDELAYNARQAYAAWEARQSSVGLLDATDEADMALARVAADAMPTLLAALRATATPEPAAAQSGSQEVPTLLVATSGGDFICALEDWTSTGLSLLEFLAENGVLSEKDNDMQEVINVHYTTKARKQLDALPEWPA